MIKSVVISGLVFLGGAITAGLLAYIWEEHALEFAGSFSEIPTLEEAKQAGWQYQQYEDFFQQVAQEKSAVYAFELAKIAPLSFGLDTHLLGHAIGDILYEQKGVGGMAYCTHDFRNACSHTIVIGALLEYGVAAVEQIREACTKAPGGSGAYTMCFHGLGHGVLAFNGYDMEETARMCRLMGTEGYNQQESDQCLGGAVMEIIGGGGHDRELWQVKRAEYLAPEDPLALCDEAYLLTGERRFCYTYITPFLFESVNADLGMPKPADFVKVFAICDQISHEDGVLRDTCFEGVGKEFIGLVAGRDFRDGIDIDEEGYRTIHEWCELANVPDGVRACRRSVVGSLYWGGENPLSVAKNFCAVADEADEKEDCYRFLVHNIDTYVKDKEYREQACATLDQSVQAFCEETLLSNEGTS